MTDEINECRYVFCLISLGLSNKIGNLYYTLKAKQTNKKYQNPTTNKENLASLWLFEHCLDFQNCIRPSLWLIMQAALDNFWNFIQMKDSDPGWSNANYDVTDLRSMHLLPVCGLWIIRGLVGPKSSDLFVKEFGKKKKKGSCITVNTPISSKNPFTSKEEGPCLFYIHFLKSTLKWRLSDDSSWYRSPYGDIFWKLLFEKSTCKTNWSQCMVQVAGSFWIQHIFGLVPASGSDCNLWAVITTECKRGYETFSSL